MTAVVLAVGAVACVLICDRRVEAVAAGRHYDDVNRIPHRNVGLLLGTSKYTIFGRDNEYYQRRIEAAYELYAKGKIDTILISGDNSKKDYNEPETMMADLVALGVPKDRFVLDYAGFRTLDSVVRAKNVFGRDSVTIISQEFHNVRALYLAENVGVDAIAFTAGVGENNGEARKLICDSLSYLGIKIDDEANKTRGKNMLISTPDSKVKVFVIPTNEELSIARDTLALVQ